MMDHDRLRLIPQLLASINPAESTRVLNIAQMDAHCYYILLHVEFSVARGSDNKRMFTNRWPENGVQSGSNLIINQPKS